MKIDLTKLNEQIELGNVNYQDHPRFPELKIYKYSKQAVYSKAWNEITLLCRGLVLDTEGNVVVNSMPKFYNNTQGEALPTLERTKGLPYEVFDKMDGSLLQVAKWNGHIVITSSGSFDSPQVHKAAEMLLTKYAHYNFEDGLTYIFEIIYLQNRIVLNYGDMESLTLLAVRNTETGEEMSYNEMVSRFNGWDIVKRIDMPIEQILAELPRAEFINKEGYVVKFANGDRVKFKYEKYMILHQVISGISEHWVWEILSTGADYRASAVDIPDELDDWIKKTAARFQASFDEHLAFVAKLYEEVVKFSSIRKEQAIYINTHHKGYAKEIFGLLDGRNIAPLIWKSLEPSGSQNMKWGAGVSPDEE